MVLSVYSYRDIISVSPGRGGFRYVANTLGISCPTLRDGIFRGYSGYKGEKYEKNKIW